MKEVMSNVAQDIINSYDQRRAELAGLQKDELGRRKEADVATSHRKADLEPIRKSVATLVSKERATLKSLRNELAAKRKSLFHTLSTEDSGRVQQATKDSARRQAGDKQRQAAEKRRRATVVSFLKEKQADRIKMSKELNHTLSIDPPKRKAYEKRRQAGSAAMMNELRVEIGGYSDGWHDLTAAMQARRGSTAATPPRVNDAKNKAVLPDSKLSRAIFEFIANSPDGIDNGQLDKEFQIGKKKIEDLTNGLVKSAN
ncbi:MAG: hypothetical protein NT177_06630, partial [Chloroflexi bacterium]|nr:hypothetical protein [Chloroflexota bacterium]